MAKGFVSKVEQINDLRSYSRQWIREFIELYKSEICLWQAKHVDYNNTALRNIAYDKLIEKLKEVEPDPKRSTVLRKINSLRSAFRREHRKKKQYKDYEPRLWYFDILSFIADQKYPATRKCFQKQTDSESNDDCDASSDAGHSNLDYKGNVTMVTIVPQSEISQESPTLLQRPVLSQQDEQQASTISATNEVPPIDSCSFKLVDFHQSNQESIPIVTPGTKRTDEYDAIGVNVASKLRNMKPTQRIIAEKLISDVLFNGQLEILTLTSKLNKF